MKATRARHQREQTPASEFFASPRSDEARRFLAGELLA